MAVRSLRDPAGGRRRHIVDPKTNEGMMFPDKPLSSQLGRRLRDLYDVIHGPETRRVAQPTTSARLVGPLAYIVHSEPVIRGEASRFLLDPRYHGEKHSTSVELESDDDVRTVNMCRRAIKQGHQST
jgi:hypothetical protein